ncbi:hypothetical protein [Dyadobacter sp. CY323]|uniref:hypothetical protein n=1 Tax=Dyadobacter sp. CY323 TaxID=2907302 RepID=UPI001F1C4E5A|nr:hypothetical protein [Dyadobacter sp. CY323]MCE6989983.1 hypothetical protein [Dyadobacter sp. CY323]
MKKAPFILAFLLISGMLTFSTKAQSIVDPGISVHNYKHPNKAAQAKSNGEQKSVRVANYNTVERAGKSQRRRDVSNTPKYAPRPATLVVVREYKKEGIEINPLLSSRNYKTPNLKVAKDTSELADINTSVYPTTD